jgi:hypothetical protein
MIYRELNVVEWIVYVESMGKWKGVSSIQIRNRKNFKIVILTDPLLSYSAINHLTQWKAVRHGSLHAKTRRCL